MLIDDFHAKGYEFLSNFYGGAYSVEHEFQAAKATSKDDEYFVLSAPTPGEAKRRGRMIKCRDDWEGVKMDVMMAALEKKFSKYELRVKLLGTGDADLKEGNYHHDNEWGSCMCKKCGDAGENILGQMLMDVRKRIRLGEIK